MIPQALLQQVADTVEQQGVGETVLAHLRSSFPGVHFSYCMDDDVCDAAPALQRGGFNLYWVDGRDHCLCLTNDAACATGLLVAEVLD